MRSSSSTKKSNNNPVASGTTGYRKKIEQKMKSVFITFDISHKDAVINILTHNNCRGFSFFDQMQGRGSVDGDPHYGSHAWPSMCGSIITIVEDKIVDKILKDVKALDEESPQLGIRAFVWNVEKSY